MAAALSADGSKIFVLDIDNQITALASADLTVVDRFDIPRPYRHILSVDPATGVFYLSGGTPPSDARKFVTVFDPAKKVVLNEIRAPRGELIGGKIIRDPLRDRLYVLDTKKIWVIDPHKHEIAASIEYGRSIKHSEVFTDLLLLPKSRRLLIMTEVMLQVTPSVTRPMFFVYDLEKKDTVFRSELSSEVRGLESLAVSPDERRLLATTGVQKGKTGSGVIIEITSSHTPSEVMAYLNFPEPVDHFVPAPDGRGMWMVAKSGQVYRLDDQTGQVLEQVSLSFRLRKVITPP